MAPKDRVIAADPGPPAPEDDGAADHLEGRELPPIALPSTLGRTLDLAQAGTRAVVYVYPRTGIPGEPLPEGWDEIPGARGCTPQSCAFRDHQADLAACGATVIGISAQPHAEQAAFAAREHIPYPLLSDERLALAAPPLRLPTFDVADMRLYRRLTLVVEARRIVKTFYPVFPPGRNAADVLAWLRGR